MLDILCADNRLDAPSADEAPSYEASSQADTSESSEISVISDDSGPFSDISQGPADNCDDVDCRPEIEIEINPGDEYLMKSPQRGKLFIVMEDEKVWTGVSWASFRLAERRISLEERGKNSRMNWRKE